MREVDRLIDEGLSRYSAGDLHGARSAWEDALVLDPQSAQAASYLEYLRQNIGVLTAGATGVGVGPFPLPSEPDYVIDVSPGELTPPPTAPTRQGLDTAWNLADDDERVTVERAPSQEPLHLELEVDEPSSGGVSFEDETREYAGQTPPIDPSEVSGTFRPEATPVGFASQDTGVKKRDTGFVKPRMQTAPIVSPPASNRPPTASPASKSELLVEKLASAPAIQLDELDLEPLDLRRPALQPRATRQMPVSARLPAKASDAPPQDDAPAALGGDDPVIGVPTRDLGLRPGGKRPPSAYPDEEVETKQSDARQIRAAAAAKAAPADPFEARAVAILAEIDADAPADESPDDRVRRRIAALLVRASELAATGETERAVTAADLALGEDPTSALAQKLVHRNKDAIVSVFQGYLGDLERQPQLAKPLQELANANLDPRAAFLLSRIDGTLSLDEILDVSGMPRLEAYRHLCQLFLRGILR